MQIDRHGLPVSSDSAQAVAHLDRATLGMLAHRADATSHLAAARAADPGMAIGHSLAGFLSLLLGRSELKPMAVRALAKARDAIAERGATRREVWLADALALWCAGEMEAAADSLERCCAAYPLDPLVGKLTHATLFMLGDVVAMRRAVEHALQAWSRDMPDYAFLLGWRAFALEEQGEFELAERVGRAAVERQPEDVWACHAVAHVHHARRDRAGGFAWLESRAAGWSKVNNFARHLHWHRALLLLETGDVDAVLALYDKRIRDERTEDYRDISNAASLLRRLERRGISVGNRWVELADIAEVRIDDHALAFAALHRLMCLIGAERLDAAARRINAMERACRRETGTQARLLLEIGLPLARTALALAEGRDPRRFRALRGGLSQLGGSCLQRQTFETILDEAEQGQLLLGRSRAAAVALRGAA